VDAAHGGKTAVNTPRGKNLIGLYHPPAAVFVFLRALATLPPAEFHAGLAECLKHGLVADGKYWEWMRENREGLLQGNEGLMERLVKGSLKVKLAVVAEDPREVSGHRNLLNAGHTVGHALEVLSGYARSHGSAVAEGLLWEAGASVRGGFLAEGSFREILAETAAWGFLPEAPLPAAGAILEAARSDKKNRGGEVRYVPLGGIGEAALPAPHTAPLHAEGLRWARERLRDVLR